MCQVLFPVVLAYQLAFLDGPMQYIALSPTLSPAWTLSLTLLFLAGPSGWTLDLAHHLALSWTLKRTCHQPSPAQILWNCTLVGEGTALPVLWSASVPSLSALMEWPCSCCLWHSPPGPPGSFFGQSSVYTAVVVIPSQVRCDTLGSIHQFPE